MLMIVSVNYLHLAQNRTDIKADSLHWVQLIIAVEGAFNIEVDVDSMKKFVTINDFVQHIEQSGK